LLVLLSLELVPFCVELLEPFWVELLFEFVLVLLPVFISVLSEVPPVFCSR
jgi:hypothetical protein